MAEKQDYTIKRSSRKTLALYIKDGTLEVRVPFHVSHADIARFVQSKSGWIDKHLSQSVSHVENRNRFTLNYGDKITYRGQEYPVVSKAGNVVGFDGSVFYFPENLTPEDIKSACVQIFRRLAKAVFTERVVHFSKVMGVAPTCVKITAATTRWGSCSSKKSLNFSWRLIMADDDAIDSVIVHELAHIKEMNHSPQFWSIVYDVLPDYKERHERLVLLQQKLNSENWE